MPKTFCCSGGDILTTVDQKTLTCEEEKKTEWRDGWEGKERKEKSEGEFCG